MSSVLNVFLHGAVCTYINLLYSSHQFWKAKIYWFENKIMTTMISCPEQSRKCPLCTRQIGAYLIHHIRSNLDFQKYYLPPQSTSPLSSQQSRQESRVLRSRRTAQSRRWGRTERRAQEAADELERAIDRRRWIYQNRLFAKVSLKV